ncbi:MAG: hypothetical protein PT957_02400 [Firmicutes bacterium]|uniref:hypothetical protein n=1 Tax=Kallipyga massiliensis TaxID=1472764 RepID=UPI0012B57B6F|nr:hypothetical protein [Kallipyga massiliensis]MDD7732585.1 hypothetical protein [Bacillota bacterium]
MKRWRMITIQALLLAICLFIIYIALGPVVDLSHRMALDNPSLAVFRPWILCMAWIILMAMAASAGILFLAFFRVFRNKEKLYSFFIFVSLKGAAKSLEVSQVTLGLLDLLLFIAGVRSMVLLYLFIGLLVSLLVSQVLRLFAEVVRDASDMKDDLELTI